MKKLLYIFTLPAMVMVTSCGGGEESVEGETTTTEQETNTGEIDTKGLREIDLTEHELNVTVMVPETYHKDEDGKEWFNQPIIEHNEGEARWEITMPGDKHWRMVIEDWGDDTRSLEIEKKEHEDQSNIFDFIYEQEGEDYLLYSKILKQDNTTISPEDAKLLPNYHFFVVKHIDGAWITIRSHEMGDFRGVSARLMLNAARSMKSALPA